MDTCILIAGILISVTTFVVSAIKYSIKLSRGPNKRVGRIEFLISSIRRMPTQEKIGLILSAVLGLLSIFVLWMQWAKNHNQLKNLVTQNDELVLAKTTLENANRKIKDLHETILSDYLIKQARETYDYIRLKELVLTWIEIFRDADIEEINPDIPHVKSLTKEIVQKFRSLPNPLKQKLISGYSRAADEIIRIEKEDSDKLKQLIAISKINTRQAYEDRTVPYHGTNSKDDVQTYYLSGSPDEARHNARKIVEMSVEIFSKNSKSDRVTQMSERDVVRWQNLTIDTLSLAVIGIDMNWISKWDYQP